jgi:hypothetical protein
LLHFFFKVLVVEPCYTLALFPEASALHLVNVSVDTLPVLLAKLPLSSVLAAIGPGVDPETVLFIVNIFSFISPSVWPRENTLTIHIIILPFARIHLAVGPGVGAKATDHIISPVSIKY